MASALATFFDVGQAWIDQIGGAIEI